MYHHPALTIKRVYLLIMLIIRAVFFVFDVQYDMTFRIVSGVLTLSCLGAAFYYYHNASFRTYLLLVGFFSYSLGNILTSGGLTNSNSALYILAFSIISLWLMGIHHYRLVFKATVILIAFLVLQFVTGFTENLQSYYDVVLMGLPVRESMVLIALLIALLLIAKDYSQKSRELFEINHKQEQFITHLNHEIRNPLQGIKGVLDVLSHHEISASRYQFLLRNVIRTTEHLNDTIDGVLNIKQLRSGNFIDTPIPVNIRDVTSKTLFIYEEQAHQKGLSFDVQFHDNLPEQVFVAQKSFKIILSNIVGNAVKFTSEGGIKVQIETDLEHKNIILKVEDTGIGILDEYTDQIFEQYFQIEQSSTKKYQGTGLGLSIVQQILNELAGTIDVKSSKNGGSVFQITIPYKRVRKPKQDSLSDTENDAPALPNLAGVSVLIVEDNFINRTILKEQLIACAVNIKEAENGEEALELLDFHHFDIVLSDIAMPKLDGLGLINKIRETDATTPVIAISGNTMPDEVRSYYDAGFNYVLSKPYTTEKLYDVIIKIRKKQLHSFGQ